VTDTTARRRPHRATRDEGYRCECTERRSEEPETELDGLIDDVAVALSVASRSAAGAHALLARARADLRAARTPSRSHPTPCPPGADDGPVPAVGWWSLCSGPLRLYLEEP
jgi:hypothetical protein